jgi:FtsZ-interacting cell division protein ZipA
VAPASADLYSTGASGAVPVRPVNATNAVESTDRIGEGRVVRDPEKPSVVDQENRDWTLAEEIKQKEEVEEPPKEPISKQLIEFIQSMWRASAMAVEQAQEVSKADDVARNKLQVRDEPLTYSEPKVKRTGGL